MTNEEIIKKIAENDGNITKAAAKRAFKCTFDTIAEELKNGGKVTIPGFGTFSCSDVKEHKGKNPQTGEEMTIPAHIAPKFKASSSLKSAVNKK